VNLNYSFVAQRAGHRCEYCRAPEVVFNLAFEVDHIIPLSKNGRDEEKNWALS
jgi:5-methylcytosine-specific restriction endonuclease McrA